MGTFGTGSFQNDWALDWLGHFREGDNAQPVREALTRVVEHGVTRRFPASLFERLRGRHYHTDWLTANAAAKAQAAAEVVAAWRGHPSATLPDGVMEWLQRNAASFQPDLVPLAQQAMTIVKTNSELKDLWEEGDATEWRNVVTDLELRLSR